MSRVVRRAISTAELCICVVWVFALQASSFSDTYFKICSVDRPLLPIIPEAYHAIWRHYRVSCVCLGNCSQSKIAHVWTSNTVRYRSRIARMKRFSRDVDTNLFQSPLLWIPTSFAFGTAMWRAQCRLQDAPSFGPIEPVAGKPHH